MGREKTTECSGAPATCWNAVEKGAEVSFRGVPSAVLRVRLAFPALLVTLTEILPLKVRPPELLPVKVMVALSPVKRGLGTKTMSFRYGPTLEVDT